MEYGVSLEHREDRLVINVDRKRLNHLVDYVEEMVKSDPDLNFYDDAPRKVVENLTYTIIHTEIDLIVNDGWKDILTSWAESEYHGFFEPDEEQED